MLLFIDIYCIITNITNDMSIDNMIYCNWYSTKILLG